MKSRSEVKSKKFFLIFMQQTRGQCLPQRELAPDSYNISKLLEESSQDLNLLKLEHLSTDESI